MKTWIQLISRQRRTRSPADLVPFARHNQGWRQSAAPPGKTMNPFGVPADFPSFDRLPNST
jgi:hypothetical protein